MWKQLVIKIFGKMIYDAVQEIITKLTQDPTKTPLTTNLEHRIIKIEEELVKITRHISYKA